MKNITTDILLICLICSAITIAILSYSYYRLDTPQATDCPNVTQTGLSHSPIICGDYQLITPTGLEGLGGNTTVWINTLHFLPNGCGWSIKTLIPKANQRQLTVSAYNTSNTSTEIFDIPAYLVNSTGRHFQILEYQVNCGIYS